jgi:hypothetical protein
VALDHGKNVVPPPKNTTTLFSSLQLLERLITYSICFAATALVLLSTKKRERGRFGQRVLLRVLALSVPTVVKNNVPHANGVIDGTSLGTLEGVSLGIELGMSEGAVDGVSDGMSDGISDGIPDGGSDRMSCSSSTAFEIVADLLPRLVNVTGKTTTRMTKTSANGMRMRLRLLMRGMVVGRLVL